MARTITMTGELCHPAWRKSSYSTDQANCVEVAALGWRTSSSSTSQPAAVVEHRACVVN